MEGVALDWQQAEPPPWKISVDVLNGGGSALLVGLSRHRPRRDEVGAQEHDGEHQGRA